MPYLVRLLIESDTKEVIRAFKRSVEGIFAAKFATRMVKRFSTCHYIRANERCLRSACQERTVYSAYPIAANYCKSHGIISTFTQRLKEANLCN